MINRLLIFAIFIITSGIVLSCTDEEETTLKEFNSELEILGDQPSLLGRSSSIAIIPITGVNRSNNTVCRNSNAEFYVEGGSGPYQWTVQGGSIVRQGGEYINVQTGTSSLTLRVRDRLGNTAAIGPGVISCNTPPRKPNPTPTPSPVFDIRIDVLSGSWNNSSKSVCPSSKSQKKKLELFATSGTPPFNWTIQGAKVLFRSGSSIFVEVPEASSVKYLFFRVVDGKGKVGELRGKVDPGACGICGNKSMKSSCLCNPCQTKCGGGERKNCPEDPV